MRTRVGTSGLIQGAETGRSLIPFAFQPGSWYLVLFDGQSYIQRAHHWNSSGPNASGHIPYSVCRGYRLSIQTRTIWKCKLPTKIKVFIWQLCHNRLQSTMCLKNRGWQGSKTCCFCGELDLWGFLDRQQVWVSRKLGLFAACFAWALWNNWNKITIKHWFPNKSTDVIYAGVNLLQKWRSLLIAIDRDKLEGLMQRVLKWLHDVNHTTLIRTDVEEI